MHRQPEAGSEAAGGQAAQGGQPQTGPAPRSQAQAGPDTGSAANAAKAADGFHKPKRHRRPLKAVLNRKTVERLVVSMQRGANDAAVVEIRSGHLAKGPIVNAVGQLLYRVGTQTEYLLLNLGRALRWLSAGLRHFLASLLGALGGPMLRFAAGMVRDITAPWRRLASGLRNVHAAARAESQRGGRGSRAGLAYFARGVRAYRHLITAALGWLLPVGAACLFAFTAHTMLANGFSLQVEYQGHVLGFVASESVWENAAGIVRGRIIATGEEEQWDPQPQFTIRPVNIAARSSATQLADDIIATSGEQIQNATGLYAGSNNEVLLGVTTDGPALQEYLNGLLEPYLQPDNPNHQVEFAQQLHLEPGVYFTSSVTDLDTVLANLNANPFYMQVQTTDLEEYDEAIPIEELVQESDEYYEGTRRVIQRGQEGLQHVTALVTRLDGVEIGRSVQSAAVLTEMVPQITVVGTRERYNNFAANSGQVGTGTWSFPVPDYTSYSTYGGHRGYDFQAPYGSPIYACEAGTVIQATYHSSWGNYVLIDHHNGLYSLYGHCSQLFVSAGQEVARGQLIGAVGMTGTATGNHLHLEVWTDPSGARWCLANPLDFVTPP